MLQKFYRKSITFFYKPLLAHYLKKPRKYSYKPFEFTILPGVFHPAFFYSTKFLLHYVNQLNLYQKSVVEVGAGNGLIAFNTALRAHKVVALEISKIAIKGLNLNLQRNSKLLPTNVLSVVESDLFISLTPNFYDYIIVNPPYYPKKVNNELELAWNCGEEHEYFTRFFKQVVNFMTVKSKIIMVLSNQCNLIKIDEIAAINGLGMQVKATKKFLIEDNFIFEITLNESK